MDASAQNPPRLNFRIWVSYHRPLPGEEASRQRQAFIDWLDTQSPEAAAAIACRTATRSVVQRLYRLKPGHAELGYLWMFRMAALAHCMLRHSADPDELDWIEAYGAFDVWRRPKKDEAPKPPNKTIWSYLKPLIWPSPPPPSAPKTEPHTDASYLKDETARAIMQACRLAAMCRTHRDKIAKEAEKACDYSVSIAYTSNSFDPASEYSYGVGYSEQEASAIQDDMDMLASGIDHIALLDAPLWKAEENKPNVGCLFQLDNDWPVWAEWSVARINGVSWSAERALAYCSAPSYVLAQGVKAANGWIAARLKSLA